MKKIRIADFGRFGFITLCVLFISAQLTFSADTFQNNLLKADIYKSPVGGLKVVLFTGKPYNDTVIVNKKSDFEYVILMPETSNSMTAKPSLKFVGDVVKGFEVKTQQYSNQVKGYTKIVIMTTKPIEIVSQIQTLKTTDYKLAENDYKELLAQGVKTKVSSAKKEVAKVIRPVETKASTKQSLAKPVKRVKSVKETTAPVAAKVKQAAKVSPTVKQKIAEPKVEEKAPVTEQAATAPQVVAKQTAEQIAQQAITPTPSESVEKKTVEVNNAFSFKNIKSIIKNNFSMLLGFLLALFLLLILVARKINRNTDKQKEIFTTHLEERPEPVTNYEENITADMTWKEKFQTYVETSQQSSQKENLEQQSTAEVAETPASEIEPNQDLDNLFGGENIYDGQEDKTSGEIAEDDLALGLEEEFPQEIDEAFMNPEFSQEFAVGLDDGLGEEIPEEDVDKYSGQEDYLEQSEDVLEELASDTELNEMIDEEVYGQQNASLEELFGDDEIEEFEMTEEIQEFEEESYEKEGQDEEGDFVQAEFAIDEEKGFYLVDFEDATALVGHIGDEIFVLKRFEEKMYGPIHARLNEKKAHTASYMVKIGDFRAMVEVAQEDMNLLIEL